MNNISIAYEKRKNPHLVVFYKNGYDIYGLHTHSNEVFRFNIIDKELYYYKRFWIFDTNAIKPFHSVIHYQEFIFFIPFWNTELVIYNSKKDTWTKIEIPIIKELELKKEKQKSYTQYPGNFYEACLYKNQLFLLPFGCRYMLKYNIATQKISCCMDFGKTILKDDIALFRKYIWIDDTNIALSCLYSNHIVFFDLETNEIEIKTIGNSYYRFSAIFKFEKSIWLVIKNELAFLEWIPSINHIKEFKNFPDNCSIENNLHCFDESSLFIYKDFLYCFPAACNMAIKFDLTNKTIKEIKSLTKYCQDSRLNRKRPTFDGGMKIENKVYLQYQLEKILEFDLETEKVYLYDQTLKNTNNIKKRQKDTLLSFLKNICNENDKDYKRIEGTAGKEIYNTLFNHIQ